MKTLAVVGAAALTILAGIIYIDNRQTIQHATARAADATVVAWQALLWLVLAIIAALGLVAVAIGISIYRQRVDMYDSNRARDGSYPLREYKLRRRFGLFGGVTMLVDPNNMESAAALIGDHGYREAEAVREPVRLAIQATRTAQALTPGDTAISSPNGSMYRPASSKAVNELARRAITVDAKPVTPATPLPALPAPVTPVTPRLDLLGAVTQSTPDAWIVGQAETGALAMFNPRAHAHAAIVGATGTGKTTSVGYALVLQAMRQRYHCIILDPDGGSDWSRFAHHCEWHEADRTTFGDQVGALHRLFESRIDGASVQPTFVVLEEYGDLIRQLRSVSRTDADAVDGMLDTLLRRGRKRGIHLCFIDQYPEHWSQQIIGGTKFRSVFQLGPNQGAKLEEYKAAQLPDRGVFLVRGEQFRSWDASTEIADFLRHASPTTGPRIIDGTGTVVSVRPSGTAQGGGSTSGSGQPDTLADTEPDTPTDAQQRIMAYYAANPTAGVREAARVLGLSKTYVSDVRRAMIENEPPALLPPTTLDISGRPQTVIDAADPANAAALAEIRAAIEAGQANIKPRR